MDLPLFLKLEIYGICLAILAILWFSGERRRESKSHADARLYRGLLLTTAAMLLTNALGFYLDGRPGELVRAGVWAANTLYFLIHSLPIPLALLYADFQLFRDEKRLPRVTRRLAPVVAGLAILALLTPALKLLFDVDEGNRYVRGPWFNLYAASQFILSAVLVWYIARNRRRVSRSVFTVLIVYPFPMIVAAALQTLFPGLALLWPVMTLFILTVAMNIENRRSRTDFLTGAANRRSLDEELARRIEAARAGRGLCGLLIDIDDFKAINDQYGHEAGDRALEDLSAILLASVRVDDFVARMGGDEFVALADSTEPLLLDELVRRIEAAAEGLAASGERPYSLSLSIGRAAYDPGRGGSAADFLAALDADMYGRKRDRARRAAR